MGTRAKVHQPLTERTEPCGFLSLVLQRRSSRILSASIRSIHRDHWLDRSGQGVIQKNGRITAIKTLCGATYKGRMFIDATYEGDLLAAAGVDYHVGREAIETYDEDWNGVQTGVFHHRHHFCALLKRKSAHTIYPAMHPAEYSRASALSI